MNIFLTQFWTVNLLIHKPQPRPSDFKFTVLEQSRSPDLVYRKEREKYHIRQFNSYYRGLNRAPE